MKKILFIISVTMIFGFKVEPKSEIYLIPIGFRGEVNVIFNQASGKPPVYEGTSRIYSIPEDGVLLTQFKYESVVTNKEFFYVDDKGTRVALKIIRSSERNEHKGEVGVYKVGTKGRYGSSTDEKSLKYEAFYVTTNEELDGYFSEAEQEKFYKKIKDLTGYRF